MVETANLAFILIVKQEKKFPAINLHGNPKMCIFADLNFAFNPQNSAPLRYTKINLKKILLLLNCCAKKEDFELSLHYTFRHRIETGGLASYKYQNNKSVLMLVAIILVLVGVFVLIFCNQLFITIVTKLIIVRCKFQQNGQSFQTVHREEV